MPANDTYWRCPKKMHVIFAASVFALFAVTLWMMGADHNREYFEHQKVFERLQVMRAEAKLAALENPVYTKKLNALEEEIKTAKADLDSRASEVDNLKTALKKAELAFTLGEATLKLRRSERDKARADFDLAVRDEVGEQELKARRRFFDERQKIVDEQTLAVEGLRKDRDYAQQALKDVTKELDDLKARKDELTKEVTLVQKALHKIVPESGWVRGKRKIMEWPIIQGFNSHLKVRQDWMPNLPIKLGMTSTGRIDRCRSCHLGIDQVEAGNLPTFPHGDTGTDSLTDWVQQDKYPHPYSTHPNPDLFLTDSSPHATKKFGCTICHDGNGSGTSFQNAEHGPNDPHQAHDWKKDHHYHANHFWEYPMQSRRLIESTCIKCHHNVEELGHSPKFGASAPKVFTGYRTIQQYGCFGCHEVHGFERGKSIGPDMRLEPNFTEAAQQFRWLVKQDENGPKIDKYEAHLNQIINFPEESQDARAKITELIKADEEAKKEALKKLATTKASAEERAKHRAAIMHAHLSGEAIALVDQFKETDHPGTYRKVGPSLRYVKSKTSRDFLRYWTANPQNFRPSTRMPRFFDLTNMQDAHGAKLSEVQIAAIAQYLHDKSQKIDLLSPPKGFTPDAKRGKVAFEQRGCLACHSHSESKDATANFGPDLSRIAAKIKRDSDNPNFSKWLYTWVREPQRHHKRSKMPDLFLAPTTESKTVDGKTTTSVHDDAADIVAYLLQGNADTEKLRKETFRNHADDKMPAVDEKGLNELVDLFVNGKLLTNEAFEKFMKERKYPATNIDAIKGDEIELARGTQQDLKGNDAEWLRVRMNFIGRRTISQYGCYACHDIPGFERARPIGTSLQNWGRKERSQLAFEHIKEYLHHHGEPDGSSTAKRAARAMKDAKSGAATDKEHLEKELSAAFFYESLLHHDRAGFIWQKLRAPRSYDHEKIETKRFDERLRMPKFPFDEEQIEQVATFVLGLVAEPPPEDYQYKPAGPAYDRVHGERLLNKYNCTGCHMVELPKVTFWADLKQSPFARRAGEKEPDVLGVDLLRRLMPARQVDTSVTKAKEGEPTRTRISFHGLRIFEKSEDPEEDDQHYFANWEHLQVNDATILPGPTPLRFKDPQIISIDAGRGGTFAEWLYGRLKKDYRQLGPKEANLARHRLPPVLYREGFKVQTPWLYQFLRNPQQLRHMTVLRMPRFNMSSQDAQILANYFAAVDGVPYPYQQVPQKSQEYLQEMELKTQPLVAKAKFPDYQAQSWKLLTNPNLCQACHTVAGQAAKQSPGAEAVRGPNLEHAADRLRPDWTLLWLSDPRWITPYTAMPVNFSLDKQQFSESFDGKAGVQVQAVRDALMNYHRLLERHRDTKFQYPAGQKPPGTTALPASPQQKPEREPPRRRKPADKALVVVRPDRNLDGED